MSFINENFLRASKRNEAYDAKPRIEFIDLAKGICIILVVLVHADVDFSIPNFQALRMPLYFVLSGLFFRDYGGILNLTERKINKLLIPFIFFYLISFLCIWLTKRLTASNPLGLNSFWNPFFSKGLVNGALWFLLCLFWCNVIWFFISQLPTAIYRVIALILTTVCGVKAGYYGVNLPLFLGSALISLPFFYLGVALGSSKFLYPNKYERFTPLLCLLFLGVAYWIYYSFDRPVITTAFVTWHGSLLLGYVNSACMVIGILLICKMIIWIPIISYIGRYSIMILVTHVLIIGLLAGVVEGFIGITLSRWATFGYTLLLCWLLIPVMKNYLPHVTAQKDWFSFSKIKGLFTPPH